jgi:HAD superfamily hydrolase (TIGR01484 family)
MSRPFDLVALDLDGTLLNDDENLPDLNRDILVALHACGVEIAFCTGRSTRGALAALQVFPVDFSFWLVTLNGVYIYDKGTIQSSNRPLLHSNVASSEFAGKLLDFSKDHDLMLECQTEDTDRFLLMRTNENREFFTRHETELSYMPIKVIDSCSHLRGQAFAHMHVFSPDAHSVDIICERLRSRFPTDQAHLIRQVYRNIHWIEIKPPNVCKGAGLAKLCLHLNIDLNRVIAFGLSHFILHDFLTNPQCFICFIRFR